MQQAFYWVPAHAAMVYNFWHNISAARLRGMVSTAKGNNQIPDWISLDIWYAMWVYWNTERTQTRSRITAENRMSNRDGLGLHAHTSGASSFNQRQREGAEPSMLRVLRDTHRRPDGHVFGVGGQPPIRERAESSTMAATCFILEHQVRVLEEQFSLGVQQMNRYFPCDGTEPYIPTAPRTQETMDSATSPACVEDIRNEPTFEAAEDVEDGEEGRTMKPS
ncbi:unnamed protein product [Arabis nemorensis]|uniref:Uncharacterized protein n=1 Tax=Arabis nemorensis TaxID=586526 RepID=A0A565C4W1_9BRAS|nr:unnamed protein product [Arabis nemorensis]